MPKPCVFGECNLVRKFPAGDNKRRFGEEEYTPGFEERGDLPEEFFRVRYFMDDEDGECGIERFVLVFRQVDGIGLALVQRNPRKETFCLHFPPDDPEHLLLQVHSDDPATIPNNFCELTGEKSRAAPKIKNPVTRFDVAVRKAGWTVYEPAQAGVEVVGTRRIKHRMLPVFPGFFTRGHQTLLDKYRDKPFRQKTCVTMRSRITSLSGLNDAPWSTQEIFTVTGGL